MAKAVKEKKKREKGSVWCNALSSLLCQAMCIQSVHTIGVLSVCISPEHWGFIFRVVCPKKTVLLSPSSARDTPGPHLSLCSPHTSPIIRFHRTLLLLLLRAAAFPEATGMLFKVSNQAFLAT